MSTQGPQIGIRTSDNYLVEVGTTLDPRESMRVLPSAFQGFLTLLTGKPFQGQVPWSVSIFFPLAVSVLSTFAGIVCSSAAIIYGHAWLLLLLPGWMVTLHGIRDLRSRIFHQCSHDNLFGRKEVDTFIGEALSTFLLIQDFRDYKYEHISEHHSIHHMTLKDPTVKALLITFGLRCEMTRKQLWFQVLKKLFSPIFHLHFFITRIFTHFLPASPIRRTISIVYWIALFTLVTIMHSWIIFLVAWFLPLILLFQLSNSLRLFIKHVFPQPGIKKQGRAYFADLTYGVFLGDYVPIPSLPAFRRFWAWTGWWTRLLFIHFPLRYLVVTGDNVCHDYHHRHPKAKNWPNYIFARQEDIITGHSGWPPYREVWGFVEAVNLVFDSLRNSNPAEFDVSKIEATNARELFSAFDD